MTYPSQSAHAPALFQIVSRKPVANPCDVAELFECLDVQHLPYHEFQMSDEPLASGTRTGSPTPRSVAPQPFHAMRGGQPLIVLRSRPR